MNTKTGYSEDPSLEVSRSIPLPLADKETDIDEVRDEAESESESSDVEKSVTSEHCDDKGGLAISTCAVGPLLSTNDQRPRS